MIGRIRTIPGFIHGLRHPSAALVLIEQGNATGDEWLAPLEKALSDFFRVPAACGPGAPHEPGARTRWPLAEFLIFWIARMHQAARVPVFEQGKILAVHSETGALMIAIPDPHPSEHVIGRVFSWFLGVLNAVHAGREIHDALRELPVMIRLLEHSVRHSSNMPRFFRAAWKLGIPYVEIAGRVYQFGYGSRSRRLDSSFTDETPQIAARLARNKNLTARALVIAGIPVPEHRIVTDPEGARKAADQLGYPVVVKPADQDGGIGVFAGLASPEELEKAFSAARRSSSQLLVERHIDGCDYRLTVFQGKLIWAIERVPGGVTGDGSSTVSQLLDRLNGDPRRGEGPHAPLKRIDLDDEARAMLAKAGRDSDSVPGLGEFVRLRRTANVARGGMPVPVSGKVHPDNALLAIRAAATLQLDLAGVDLLIPDIGRSWRETGGAVCEVNGQPNLGETTAPHLYSRILRTLVQGNGRIPVAVFVGAPPEWRVAAAVASRLEEHGLVTGRGDHEGVSIGTAAITAGVPDPYTAGRLLVGEKEVAAIVLCINDTGILRKGLPFERFDVLVVAGRHLVASKGENTRPPEFFLRSLFDALAPCCDGKVFVVEGAGVNIDTPLRCSPAEVVKESLPPDQVATAIADEMIAAGLRHAAPLAETDGEFRLEPE